MLEALITAGLIAVVSVAMAVSTPDSPSSDLTSGKSAASGEADHIDGAAHGHEAAPSPSGTLTSSSPTTPVSKTVVNVSLTDLGGPKGQGTGGYSPEAMGMITDHATVPHGTVTFKVKNIGAVDHEMLILPLADAEPIGSRPFGGDARIDDSGKLHDESGKPHDESGATHDGSHAVPNALVTVTMTLSPGRYELVCNHPGHYVSGMFTQLTVT